MYSSQSPLIHPVPEMVTVPLSSKENVASLPQRPVTAAHAVVGSRLNVIRTASNTPIVFFISSLPFVQVMELRQCGACGYYIIYTRFSPKKQYAGCIVSVFFSKFCIHFSIPPQTAFRQEGQTVLFRHFTTGAM